MSRQERELKSPLPETAENLAEGKRLFFNYCQSCHGETGMGDGPVYEKKRTNSTCIQL